MVQTYDFNPEGDSRLYLACRMPRTNRLRRIALSKPRRNDIFIAYAAADGSLVRPIDEAIRQQGFDPWIDYDDLITGADYEAYDAGFRQGIRGADVFVLLLTGNTAGHRQITEGLKLAVELNKLVLLVARAEVDLNAMDIDLADVSPWLPVRATTAEDTFYQLALNIIHIQTYVRLLARSVEWERHDHRSSQLLTEEDLHAVEVRKEWIERQPLGRYFQITALQQQFLAASSAYVKDQQQQQLAQRSRPEVFISYSSKDREFVKDLVGLLRQRDWKIWVDWENIPVATNWREEVEDGILEAHTFLIVISPDSVISEHCQWETDTAHRYHKRVIPVIWRDGYDPKQMRALGLSSIQYVSFTKQPQAEAQKELLGALKTDLDDAKTYTRLFGRAHEWGEHYRRERYLLSFQELREMQRWCQQRKIEDAKDNRVMAPLLPLQEEYLRASQMYVNLRRRKSIIVALAITSTVSAMAVLLTMATLGEIRALVASLEQRTGLDALVTALRAGKQLKRNDLLVRFIRPSLRSQATTALHEATLGLRELNRLTGHQGGVFDVAFSPDGRQLASVGEDLSLRLWQLQENGGGEPLYSHSQEVVAVTYSSDGDLIATASYDGAVKLWTPEGELYKTLPRPHRDWVLGVEFSPGAQSLASISYDGRAYLWSRQDDFRQPVVLEHPQPVGGIAFSPYGREVVTADFAGNVSLWSREGQPLDRLAHGGAVFSLQYSPDGTKVAMAGDSGEVRLWDLAQGTTQVLGTHDGPVYQIAFSPDGSTLASASEDSTVKLWQLGAAQGTARLAYTLRGHEEPVHRVVFSPDGRMVATAGADNAVRLWLRDKGTLLEVLEGHGDEILSLAFTMVRSPQQRENEQAGALMLASSSKDGDIRLWDLDAPIQPLPHDNRVYDVAFRPDGQVVASSGIDTIRLWRPDAKLRSHLYSGDGDVYSLSYHPKGELLAAGVSSGRVQLWKPEVSTTAPLLQLEAHGVPETAIEQGVQAVRFSPNGRWLASGGADQTVKLWATKDLLAGTETPRHVLSFDGTVTSLSFSADSQRLTVGRNPAATERDGDAQIWDLTRDRPQLEHRLDSAAGGHSLEVMAVATNPTNGWVATGGMDNTVRLWSRTGKLERTLNEHVGAITHLAFSADGLFLVSASQDGSIRLWSADGQLISRLNRHDREVSSVTFGPDGGHQLASASFDNTVLLWQLWERGPASGISTRRIDVLNTLMDMGCESAQPYLYSQEHSAPQQAINSQALDTLREIQEVNKFCRPFNGD